MPQTPKATERGSGEETPILQFPVPVKAVALDLRPLDDFVLGVSVMFVIALNTVIGGVLLVLTAAGLMHAL